ncbi:hypothetical protein BDN70DRAFT_876289 [Pholiota conissans]|uniref:Transmembrane protein n=1 Tax=Pholiota conissans TaxID=109636 RepID=A0A9P5Z627_9AGAR|nr:hypothetical protein BDN70DRAFT_876289 [Pholiota conissans]
MSTVKYSPVSVTEQPLASHDLPMDLKVASQSMESLGKGCHYGNNHNHHACSQRDSTLDSDHHRCHNGRLRRFLVPFLIAFLIIGGLVAYGCATGHGAVDGWGLESLMSRAVGDSTTNNGSGTFVDRKLYLIVVFVGLFVVLILAIMLSAWCCRGAFENPCCCPCYLCACCGGLACLECIGCGLCAEGIAQA